jgi:hypothetical protein
MQFAVTSTTMLGSCSGSLRCLLHCLHHHSDLTSVLGVGWIGLLRFVPIPLSKLGTCSGHCSAGSGIAGPVFIVRKTSRVSVFWHNAPAAATSDPGDVMHSVRCWSNGRVVIIRSAPGNKERERSAGPNKTFDLFLPGRIVPDRARAMLCSHGQLHLKVKKANSDENEPVKEHD